MAKIITLQCPGGHTFDWLRHPSDEPPPRFCPVCGLDSENFQQAVTMPYVSDGRSKNMRLAADQTYKDMEKSSEVRAGLAESMTGDSASALKVTNMKDNLRQGDTSFVTPPPTPVSRAIEQQPSMFGFQGGSAYAEIARAAHTGVAPHAGARAGTALNDFHARYGKQAVALSETGRY